MKTRSFADILARLEADPVRRARIAEYKRAMEDALRQREHGLPQREIAEHLGVGQQLPADPVKGPSRG